MKRENTRLDIASRKAYPKSELIRLVLVDGVVTLGNATIGGRGVYLHRDAASLDTAIRKKAFERAFRRPLTPSEIDAIKEAL